MGSYMPCLRKLGLRHHMPKDDVEWLIAIQSAFVSLPLRKYAALRITPRWF
jgi:hypothetical protein